MSLLTQSGLIFTGYLAAGRVGSIAACLILGISPWATLIIILLIDICQIPVYGMIIESSKKHIVLPKRIQTWVQDKTEKLKIRMKEKVFWQRLIPFQHMTVILVSTIPLRGFGIMSACILAAMLGYGRLLGTVLIMAGSFACSLLSICVFFFPGRYFGVL